MTPDEAEDLAFQIVAAIERDEAHATIDGYGDHYDADLSRIASDLAGLTEHVKDFCEERGVCPDPCPDIRRYAEGLRRTAALYGVTVPQEAS